MPHTSDPGLRAVLTAFNIGPDSLLGLGGEARVYALDHDRVLRVQHAGADLASLDCRRQLVDELRCAASQFRLPEIISVGEVDGRIFSIEHRLPGASVLQRLARLGGRERDLLIESHLDTSAAIAALKLRPREWFGELVGEHPLRAPTWKQFLCDRAAKSLSAAGGEFSLVNAAQLAADMPEITASAFVHLDACAANMLSVGTTITAVLDIGITSVVGDPVLDPVAAVAYISTPHITPGATSRDADVAMTWLRSAGLEDRLIPTQRWLAAYWSFATDDVELHKWCRSVLL